MNVRGFALKNKVFIPSGALKGDILIHELVHALHHKLKKIN